MIEPMIKTFEAPEQDATVTMDDAQLIKLYNINLRSESTHEFHVLTLQTLRNELISRDIITEEHEGDVVS